MSLLAEKEIYVTEGWSGRIKALQDQGHDMGYYDPPGGLGWQECLFVLKGSPMAACEELLNFMLEPEVAIAVAEGARPPACACAVGHRRPVARARGCGERRRGVSQLPGAVPKRGRRPLAPGRSTTMKQAIVKN